MMMLPLLLLSFPLFAIVDATYSIVSTDLKTREVGGAGASCVPSYDIFNFLYWSAPNRSVLHTQGVVFEIEPIAKTAVELMKRNNASIDDILTEMMEGDVVDPAYSSFFEYPVVELRQFGMADFNTNSHGGYTGKSLDADYESMGIENTEQIDVGVDRNDEDADESIRGRYSFHAQGNVVAEDTVTSLLDGFVGGDEDIYQCDMAGRLMSAMSRVVERDLGDMRCINDHNGTSASGAFLHIDNADGTELIHLNKIGDGSFEPVEEMRQEFLEWRKSNPCPVDNAATAESTPQNDTSSANETNPITPNKTTPAPTANPMVSASDSNGARKSFVEISVIFAVILFLQINL